MEQLRKDAERAIHEMVAIVGSALGKEIEEVGELGYASQIPDWDSRLAERGRVITKKGVRLAVLSSGESVCYDFSEHIATPCGDPDPPRPVSSI
jgi:hypothetical protein